MAGTAVIIGYRRLASPTRASSASGSSPRSCCTSTTSSSRSTSSASCTTPLQSAGAALHKLFERARHQPRGRRTARRGRPAARRARSRSTTSRSGTATEPARPPRRERHRRARRAPRPGRPHRRGQVDPRQADVPASTTRPRATSASAASTSATPPCPSLRHRIVVVPQEGFLFAGSIRDNVRVGSPNATDADVDAALDALGVLDRFLALPDGLDTEVRERGLAPVGRGTPARLAGPGRARRPGAARPRRGHLEPRPGHRAGRRTGPGGPHRRAHGVVVVAHRLSTAARADRIAVVDHGRLQELGRHEELLRREGRYASLWASWTAAQARAS